MAQGLRSLPHKWDTWVEFLDLFLGLVQPWCFRCLGGGERGIESTDGKIFVFLCLSAFQLR